MVCYELKKIILNQIIKHVPKIAGNELKVIFVKLKSKKIKAQVIDPNPKIGKIVFRIFILLLKPYFILKYAKTEPASISHILV